MWSFMLALLLLLLGRSSATKAVAFRGYNIALHAQVVPTSHKVVGSVITTNGLRAALKKRFDVNEVEIFYPGQYANFLNRDIADTHTDTHSHTLHTNATHTDTHTHTPPHWDFLVIEGWFLGLHELIQVTRNTFPHISIVFYCLDPTYPSLSQILLFDVDGIATNSLLVLKQCQLRGIPAIYLMLAADVDVMRDSTLSPSASLSDSRRMWNTVYVGAGGLMLEQKPTLYQVLLRAAQVGGLRLHGSGWETVPVLSEVWSGPLPQDQLAAAYASAEVVLASTIQSQDEAGMINNRIFEALSCGSIIMSSHYSLALESLLGNASGIGLIDFYHNDSSLVELLNKIKMNPEYAVRRRHAARDFVMQRHTWQHRTVKLLSFLVHLRSISNDIKRDAPRPNLRKLLWIESSRVASHPDYTIMLKPMLMKSISAQFSITFVSEEEWLSFHKDHCVSRDRQCLDLLDHFDGVFCIITPFDSLDMTISTLPVARTSRGSLQRRFAYLFGIDLLYFENCLEKMSSTRTDCRQYHHYDAIFYRSPYELNFLQNVLGVQGIEQFRSQHLFAVPSYRNVTLEDSEIRKEFAIICTYSHRHACRKSSRQLFENTYERPSEGLLLLVGGTFEQWLDEKDVLTDVLLENIIHIADNTRCDEFLDIISGVESVVIMVEGSLQDHLESGLSSLHHTLDDSLFPFVASAVMHRKIHLSAMNRQLVDIAQEGHCVGWDNVKPYEYWDVSMRFGLDRVFGMPSKQSKVEIVPLLLSPSSLNKCLNCDSQSDKLLLESGYLEHIVVEERSTFVLFRIKYINFESGTDGQLCINQVNGTVDTMMCLLRSMNYVLVTSQQGALLRRDPTTGAKLFDMVLSFRGSLFSDVVWNTTVTVTSSLRDTPPFKSHDAQHKVFRATILDDIFTYSYNTL